MPRSVIGLPPLDQGVHGVLPGLDDMKLPMHQVGKESFLGLSLAEVVHGLPSPLLTLPDDGRQGTAHGLADVGA